MKVIKEIDLTGSIMLSNVTEDHIVVGLDKSKEPFLLQRKSYDAPDKYKWVCVDKGLSKANALIRIEGKLYDAISQSLKDGFEISAFERDQWREAFLWLMENAN